MEHAIPAGKSCAHPDTATSGKTRTLLCCLGSPHHLTTEGVEVTFFEEG